MAWRKRFKDKPLVMGILNVTPDSFYDGGKFFSHDQAVDRAFRMIGEGVDIIDVGGESTRPYSEPTPLREELKRVVPVIEGIRKRSAISVSIDTYKAEVAEAAIAAGADMINDISALSFDARMAEVAAAARVPVVMMHIKGTPRNMQVNPFYNEVIGEIRDFFVERIAFAKGHGIDEENIVIDPGIGFGKRLEDNLTIIKQLKRLGELGKPILVGTSMKSFIGKIMGTDDITERAEGTLASVAISLWNGADIVRVHDVAGTRKVVQFMQALMGV
ncbi:MAG: Dihydropteroate synthase [Syntrophorhabdaceae bacterium PtaU1.Bin034]|nr:MAG: Dihydropteroate synthase [Syntrophorhabdaceae bacterium PtaU1.Bin034]